MVSGGWSAVTGDLVSGGGSAVMGGLVSGGWLVVGWSAVMGLLPAQPTLPCVTTHMCQP